MPIRFELSSCLGAEVIAHEPYLVATRQIGGEVEVKVWRPSDPEPEWRVGPPSDAAVTFRGVTIAGLT